MIGKLHFVLLEKLILSVFIKTACFCNDIMLNHTRKVNMFFKIIQMRFNTQ
jgi:hypothetical protein